MEIIVISPEGDFPNEHDWVTKLFAAGLARFHLRKPRMTEKQLQHYLDCIPENFRSRVVTHQAYNLVDDYELAGWHIKDDAVQVSWAEDLRTKRETGKILSRAIHRLDDLDQDLRGWDYVFLSPVFESISKMEYGPKWKESQLTAALRYCRDAYHTRVFALGGVDESRIHSCNLMGFDGVALLGAVWKSRYPLEAFLRAQEALNLATPS
ncbi:MAG: thiamine phosphate synthase [Verrucomicrobiae bacterium]|nr:thiamine phosphate synthase [Verrucomicrobiae bacterium]